MADDTNNPDFTIDSKKRIARTVRRVEAMPPNSGDATNGAVVRNPLETYPQYQFQVKMGVAQNAIGWGFPAAHPATT